MASGERADRRESARHQQRLKDVFRQVPGRDEDLIIGEMRMDNVGRQIGIRFVIVRADQRKRRAPINLIDMDAQMHAPGDSWTCRRPSGGFP